jgi:hypothetical protein
MANAIRSSRINQESARSTIFTVPTDCGIRTERTPQTPRMSPPTPTARSSMPRVKTANVAEMAISTIKATASTFR